MHILKLKMRRQMTAMLRGGLLAVLVLLMGAALLGLSGWFIPLGGLPEPEWCLTCVAPVRRTLGNLGRMSQATARIAPMTVTAQHSTIP